MADYARIHRDLEELGISVTAVSVDGAERSRVLSKRLALPFPLLVDAGGRAARRLGIYQPDVAGGIAAPTTWVLSADREILLSSHDVYDRRLAAADVLTFLERRVSDEVPEAPRARAVRPRLRDLPALLGRILRFGVAADDD